MPALDLRFDHAPYRLSGVVYAALLNHAPELAALGEAVNQAPYKAAPQAPVLALRPRNCLVAATPAPGGSVVHVPAGADGLQIGACLGIVIGRAACRVPASQALQWVAGYTLVNDFSLPHASHYRPAVRLKARDGFCLIGPAVLPASAVPQPDALAVQVHVDGVRVQSTDTAQRLRGVAQLIADVTDFMTLQAGDLLLLGPSAGSPRVRAGQAVTISMAGLGQQHSRCTAQAAAGAAA